MAETFEQMRQRHATELAASRSAKPKPKAKPSGAGASHRGFVRLPSGFSAAGLIRRIGCIEYGVYSVLLDHRNGQTGEAYPSVRAIAEAIGLRRRRVQQALRKLETHGLILFKSGGGRAGCPTIYFVQEWTAGKLPDESCDQRTGVHTEVRTERHEPAHGHAPELDEELSRFAAGGERHAEEAARGYD